MKIEISKKEEAKFNKITSIDRALKRGDIDESKKNRIKAYKIKKALKLKRYVRN